MAGYEEALARLRLAFPPPVSDPVHDGYVVFSILRALDQVDDLKSQAPILGKQRTPDYAAATAARLSDEGRTVEQVIPELVNCLHGMNIWGHPRSQVNVVAHPSIASVIGVVLPSMYNPNLCSDESGRGVSEAEVKVAAMTAELVGYDPETAGGLFTFGGTGTLLYGLKLGLEKAVPGCLHDGLHTSDTLRQPPVVIASAASHSACESVCGWLGIGQKNLLRVPSQSDNSMDLAALEQTCRDVLVSGRRIAGIVATMGTTDAFGMDDLEAIHDLRERLVEEFKLDYRPHIHADAVIGWAWSVYRDERFTDNSFGFRGRTVRALAWIANRIKHLPLADSLGIDFHKTGFAPYISSLFLARDQRDLALISRRRDAMPYLFHSGEYHPGMFSLETSRSGTGPMAALGSYLLLGRDGLRLLLGHAIEMAEVLRELIGSRPELTVVNPENFGPVTLFRAYPSGTDTFSVKEREQSDAEYQDELARHNEFNRRIFARVNSEAMAGRGVAIGFTDCYRTSDFGAPMVALKSYVLSPFAEAARMRDIVDYVLAARTEVERAMFPDSAEKRGTRQGPSWNLD
jgi:glutamate/tyrosine decarboxylase-like PLP-dependent enzyme